jgi:hypothetical protein
MQRTTSLFTIQLLFHCDYLFYACVTCLLFVCTLIRNFLLSHVLRVLVQDLLVLYFIFIFRSLGYSPFSCTLLLPIYCYLLDARYSNT